MSMGDRMTPAKGAALAGAREKRMSKRWLIDLVFTAACWGAAAALIALQLTGQIDSSWWWITAPLWAPIGVGVGGFVGLALLERLKPLKP